VAAQLVTPSAGAQPISEIEGLLSEQVVSGASKASERSSEAPALVSVVTAEDIRRYGLHSLNEVINYAALGMVTTNPLHSVEIGARGVLLNGDYGNHVLLLIDGHAVNEVWNGTAYYERGAAFRSSSSIGSSSSWAQAPCSTVPRLCWASSTSSPRALAITRALT